jgi:phosphoribosylaminoimidazolecarboxamide formyltransferase/IMP cyclohydrolase
MTPRIQRALLSVSDKTGLVAFAHGLHDAGVEIFSTGGTARSLREADIPVRDVSAYTGFPEMMDGRLKTLHPRIFGGILCRHDRDDDMQAIADHGILSIELVVVNLYPFQATVARPEVTWSDAVEMIDIGGPSLVRAAAKNHAFVTVATQAAQYEQILAQIRRDRATSAELRRQLAAAAFAHTAAYDQAISRFFQEHAAEETGETFPPEITWQLTRKCGLRYGENPHQAAALYGPHEATGASVVAARVLHGKELSYNNLLDADSALAVVRSLPEAAVAVIKHNNPCGAASADAIATATRRAMEGDSVSAFGSILGFNQPVDAASAEYLATPGLFVEAIVAPSFAADALEILTSRPKWKNNVRLLEVGPLDAAAPPAGWHFRHLEGGLLAQESDCQPDDPSQWQVATQRAPDEDQLAELAFAWAVVRHVKSNAIILSRQRALCGVGAGQMSRVDSVQIAIGKAGQRAKGSVMASDAFFPFPDSIQEAARAGVNAVIQPGGSRRDQEVIDACNQLGIAMVMTGRRHFKH